MIGILHGCVRQQALDALLEVPGAVADIDPVQSEWGLEQFSPEFQTAKVPPEPMAQKRSSESP